MMNDTVPDEIEVIRPEDFYHEDDFYVNQGLLHTTLFFHAFLLGLMFYRCLQLFLVISIGFFKESDIYMDVKDMSLEDAFESESSDYLYPFGESLLLLALNCLSLYALLSGLVIYSIGFIIVVTIITAETMVSFSLIILSGKQEDEISRELDKLISSNKRVKTFPQNYMNVAQDVVLFGTQVIANLLMMIVAYISMITTYADYLHLLHLHFLVLEL